MSRKSRRQLARQQPDQAPVNLSHVLITVTETGTLEVTLDGAPHPPPQDGQPWTRAEFGALLDQVTHDRTVPVRVEVRETDGTVFIDILRPRKSTTSQTLEVWPTERSGRHVKDKLRPIPVEVTADGFMPGENVAVAVVLTHPRATSTGTVSVLLDPALLSAMLSGSVIKVVLHGQVSDLTQVRELT